MTLRATVSSMCFLFPRKKTSQLLAYGLYFEYGMGREAHVLPICCVREQQLHNALSTALTHLDQDPI